MDALTISPASQLQQPIVLDILQETQQWLRFKGIKQWTLPFASEWIEESIERGEFFVAQIEQEVVAVFRLTDTDPSIWGDCATDAYYIHSLAVRRRWAGHRVGKRLLLWIERYAEKNKRAYLRLDCMADNLALCQYYEQAGFFACRVIDIPYDDGSFYRARLFEKAVSARYV